MIFRQRMTAPANSSPRRGAIEWPPPAALNRDGASESGLRALKELPDQTIIRGVLDLSTPDVETPGTVAACIRRALVYRKPEDVIVGGLKNLLRDAAFGKMKAMVEGAHRESGIGGALRLPTER
jgi:methionine synthase II (cobalamin-independent)